MYIQIYIYKIYIILSNSKCLKAVMANNSKPSYCTLSGQSPVVKGDLHSVKHGSAEQFPFDVLSTQIPSYTQMPDSPL